MLEPFAKKEPAMILEFKAVDRAGGEAAVQNALQQALGQIRDKRYDTELMARGIKKGRYVSTGLFSAVRRYGLPEKGCGKNTTYENFNKILLNIEIKSVTIILTKFLKSFKIDGGLKNE